MLTYLRSIGDSAPVSVDLLTETLLSDGIIPASCAADIVTKCFEFSDKSGSGETRRNAVILVSKIVSCHGDTLEEETVAEVLRRFISAMTEGDTEVRRTVAEYLGIVMLASKHSS